jgi:GAF domain-containing protein
MLSCDRAAPKYWETRRRGIAGVFTLPDEPTAQAPGDLTVALSQAREREAATRKILDVISRSRDDEKPVFDAILENAARLCKSTMARLHLLNEGGTHHLLAAHWGEAMHTLEIGEAWSMDALRPIPRAIREARTIRVEDMAKSELYRAGDPVTVRMVDEEGLRTCLRVPLIQGDRAFGCIALSRREVRPFGEDEIALVETFAAQAVIAIENVHQFRELQTRLEREAATREILGVISQSRADAGPVFDIILENAARLCSAPHALLLMRDAADRQLEIVASNSAKSAFIEAVREHPHDLGDDGSLAVRALHDMQVRHILDVMEIDLPHERRSKQLTTAVEIEGMRTLLLVPLIDGARAIGVICLYKLEVARFSEDEIALVQSFAAQAVIAIENVRQFRVLQTRLEREAA